MGSRQQVLPSHMAHMSSGSKTVYIRDVFGIYPRDPSERSHPVLGTKGDICHPCMHAVPFTVSSK